ncbi:MAG: hypothetical protein H6630_08950 [Arcobacter sp.]|nr:hypothetical protein [Arcobacter sp.]
MNPEFEKIINKYSVEHMPKPTFRLNVYAPSYSGKSYMINQLLTNNIYGYTKIFKPSNTYILSPTYDFDDSYKELRERMKLHKNNITDDYSNEFLDNILEKQKIQKQQGSAEPVVVLIDDLITKIDRFQAKSLENIYFKGRHYFISIILTSQQYKKVPPSMRLNACSNIYFTNSMNKNEINQIEQDQTSDIFRKCVENLRTFNYFQYDFIYVNLKLPMNERYYRNFDTIFKE